MITLHADLKEYIQNTLIVFCAITVLMLLAMAVGVPGLPENMPLFLAAFSGIDIGLSVSLAIMFFSELIPDEVVEIPFERHHHDK